MTKEKAREILIKKLGFDYIEYAENDNENDGSKGNLFEMLVKLEMGNTKFKGVASRGAFDTRKKIDGSMLDFEMKTGSGEIAHLSRQGVVKMSPTLRSDYIIHCLKFDPNKPLIEQEIFVIETAVMIERFQENKLTRMKPTTAMTNSPIPKELKFNDVWSFSLDGASRQKKYFNLMYELIDEGYGMMFEELLERLV